MHDMTSIGFGKFLCKYGLTVLTALVTSGRCYAGPLETAEVNRIVNDVRVIDVQRGANRPAGIHEVIKEGMTVRTGINSRAELLFQDNTLTRLGADTMFSFAPGTRNMTLEHGTMLLQVPKGLGGAKIRAAAVTAAITGTTIMLENLPNQNVKVVVLEGSLRLSMRGLFGDSTALRAGSMIIVGPKDTIIAQPVTVDLARLMKTSALADPVKFSGAKGAKSRVLPSSALIQEEIRKQNTQKAGGILRETNLVLQGSGIRLRAENGALPKIANSDQINAALRQGAFMTEERTHFNAENSKTESRLLERGPGAVGGAKSQILDIRTNVLKNEVFKVDALQSASASPEASSAEKIYGSSAQRMQKGPHNERGGDDKQQKQSDKKKGGKGGD